MTGLHEVRQLIAKVALCFNQVWMLAETSLRAKVVNMCRYL